MAQGRPHLTDDERNRIRILYTDAKQSVAQICRITGYSRNQVHRAVSAPQGPRRRKGPPPVIGPAEETELVEFVTSSPRNRYLPWKKVAQEFKGGIYGHKAKLLDWSAKDLGSALSAPGVSNLMGILMLET
ncbi:hypothetical protein F4782DRAFT_59424 [Xylaria castorea]|nr:hypothetical protein F4782DRAFT_59424 [Xylaria castorea]